MEISPPLPLCSFNNHDRSKGKKHKYEKIPFSSVVVKRRVRAYWGRKWSLLDMVHAFIVFSVHVMCLFAPFHFTWGALGVGSTLGVITGLFGITLGYHRNLSHQSFKLPKWLEYLFAYCGVLAMQGGPLEWVSNHRFHHKYTDKDQDPHSPIKGFWFSHIDWLFDHGYIVEKCGKRNNVADLRKQWYYRFLQSTYLFHQLAVAISLYEYGGLPFLLWGLGMRVTISLHVTFLVNSVCHIWGHKAWNTEDLSRNNWIVALFSFGEGWHNNHHAFEYSARHGLEWWQFDSTWCVIKLLESVGLATDIKLPSEMQKQKLSFKNGTKDVKVSSSKAMKQETSFVNETKTM